MKHSKPSFIIVIGPPGSGKGTQAELLAEKFNLYHFETSEIIEKNIAGAKKDDFVKIDGKKYFLTEEIKLRKTGVLMSPPLIAFWVKEKIRQLAKEGRGITTSGSPRTIYEGEKIIPFVKKLYGSKNVKVILLAVSPKTTIYRNSHRRSCKLMRHPILYTKETLKLTKCPVDGSELIVRKDDNKDVIKDRLKEYEERTFPLVKLFKKQGLSISKINGEPPVSDVFESILKTLK